MTFNPAACPIGAKYLNAPDFNPANYDSQYATIGSDKITLNGSDNLWVAGKNQGVTNVGVRSRLFSYGVLSGTTAYWGSCGSSIHNQTNPTWPIYQGAFVYACMVPNASEKINLVIGIKKDTTNTILAHYDNAFNRLDQIVLDSYVFGNLISGTTYRISAGVYGSSGAVYRELFYDDNIDINFYGLLDHSMLVPSVGLVEIYQPSLVYIDQLYMYGDNYTNSCRGNIYSDFSFSGAASV